MKEEEKPKSLHQQTVVMVMSDHYGQWKGFSEFFFKWKQIVYLLMSKSTDKSRLRKSIRQ